jgi:hypothetical protein
VGRLSVVIPPSGFASSSNDAVAMRAQPIECAVAVISPNEGNQQASAIGVILFGAWRGYYLRVQYSDG